MIDFEIYIEEIQSVSQSQSEYPEKIRQLKSLLQRLAKELTKDEILQFPNLFSRLVFIAQKHQLSKQLEWKLQHLRVLAKRREKKIDVSDYRQAERAVCDLCHHLSGKIISSESDSLAERQPIEAKNKLRVQIVFINRKERQLRCLVEDTPGMEIIVKYGVKPDNLAFNDSVQYFWEGAQLNLIDSSVDKNGCFIPKIIVLEPDYLIDASAIAECFQSYGISSLHYFQKKFEVPENRSYLLLGNLANFFLDELTFAENLYDVSFHETFLRSFKQSPFEYTSCEDIASTADFRTFMQKAEAQFENIKRVITNDFPKQHIDIRKSTLEPSFFSEKYGFQGRLDLLQISDDNDNFKIVELKSGRLPYPNYDTGKIALNHEVQTAVYRLMVESVFDKDAREIDVAILYSAGNRSGENMRFSAVFQQLEKQIVNLRNLIVANEYLLMHGSDNVVDAMINSLGKQLDTDRRLPDFFVQRIETFQDVFRQSSKLELAYFKRFVRFISREIYLQKIGDIEYESPIGVASLWNTNFAERAESLDVLYDLSIAHFDFSGNQMTISFNRNYTENEIVNFREGEICIVYPRQNEKDTVLNTQILKGYIATITKECVEVRFRYKQKNYRYFEKHSRWAIEHDTLDSSYNSMYKSLFSFLKAPKQKRDLLLGLVSPKTKNDNFIESYPENIVQKAMTADDYFLIIGPPGTGKTSIFARRLIEEYYKEETKNILVLAYTNRAVDELCEAIHSAFGCAQKVCDKYIRVGMELSCAELFRHRLLQRISQKADSRDALRKSIEKTRIFVSTLASINGKLELFNLKKFDIAIVDEASQILEPQLIGLLPRFDKFILIGDHNQLSTIVLQKPKVSAIENPLLREAGIEDCRDSLFERLIRISKLRDWQHTFVQLTQQGRMHEAIAAFPATFFYDNNLFVANQWQKEVLRMPNFDKDNRYARVVATCRTAFFSTGNYRHTNSFNKINEIEADIIISLVQTIFQVYGANNRPIASENIGIITPYRNQIALIKSKLLACSIPDYDKIMVDTVERFQGSQRDVVLISFCVNRPYQLDFLSNMDREGKVDRKLNVALTRARKQLFLVGNARVLQKHPIYTSLLEWYKNLY